MTIKADAAAELLQFLNTEDWEIDYSNPSSGLIIRHQSGTEITFKPDGTVDAPSARVGALEADDLNRTQVGTKIFDNDRTTYNEDTAKLVPFDSVAFDDDNEADLANNQIVVNEDGTYGLIFGFACRDDINGGSNVIVRPQLNGSAFSPNQIQIANSDFEMRHLNWRKKLAAGDAFRVELEYTDAGGSQSFSGNDGPDSMFLAVMEEG